MRVDRGVTSGTRQVLVLSVGNVQVRLGVTVLFGQAKVDNIDLVASLADTHQEIVGLDIAVDKVSRMYVFHARDELVGQKKYSLEREFAVAEIKQILKRRTPNCQLEPAAERTKK